MESDWEQICGWTDNYADARKNVTVSLANTSSSITYRQLCEDPAWNGLKGVQIMSDYFHCKGHRPSQRVVSMGKCDGAYDCIDRSDEAECPPMWEAPGSKLCSVLLLVFIICSFI